MAPVIAHSSEPLVIPALQVPSTAKLTVKVGARTVSVPLAMVRRSWVFVASFPAATSIPPGTHSATLPSANGPLAIELKVQPGPSRHRVLVPARSKPANPYTILLLANPRFLKRDGTQVTDPILRDRAGFGSMVHNILDGLLAWKEDLLSSREDKGLLQIETLFDAGLGADPTNCLVLGGTPVANAARVRTVELKPFLAKQGLKPDIVYLIHGMADYTRPTGVPGIDASTGPQKAFTVDGKPLTMGAFPDKPGAVAMLARANFADPVAMHEFGHAASLATCWVTDLYHETSDLSFNLNKKRRPSLTAPVPASFGTYNNASFASAPDRWPAKPYKTASYFPARVALEQPNLMDQYLDAPIKKECRFDKLTGQWLADRLDFKMAR